MPAHHRLGPDDRNGPEDRWKPAIQLDEEQAVTVRETDPTVHFAPQNDQLMAKSGILRFKSALGLEERGAKVPKEEYQRGHRGRR